MHLRLEIAATDNVGQILDRVMQTLKKNGINIPENDLLFTGIRATKKRVDEVLMHGILAGKNSTFAATSSEMRGDNLLSNAITYAYDFEAPGLVVYRREDLCEHCDREYVPVEGKTFKDAFIAILSLQDELPR